MDLRHVGALLAVCATAWMPADSVAQTLVLSSAREFVNTITGHYFVTASLTEAAGIEAGAAGPGWQSTTYVFLTSGDIGPPVCRFYAPPPTNSHFYTADPAECDFLKTHDTGWKYEGIAFHADVPVNGMCASGLSPITRLYNNRAAAHDSNHRYSGDDRVIAQMKAQGWVVEGVAFCSLAWYRDIRATATFLAPGTGPSAFCHTGGAPGGNAEKCVALSALVDMNQQLNSYGANISVPNPAYTKDFAAKTGWIANVDTVFARSFDAGSAERSFVEAFYGGAVVGVHLVGAERRFGDHAAISPTLANIQDFAARLPVAPWDDRGQHDLIVNFQLKIATLIRSDDSAQVSGGPVLDFLDQASGQHLLVRVLAYGSQAPSDSVGIDPVSGLPMVSTSFAAASFGRVLKGQYIQCAFATLATGGCPAAGIDYSFRLERDDFAKVLAAARGFNASFSGDVADYRLIALQMRNQTFRDAELGLLENQIQVIVTE